MKQKDLVKYTKRGKPRVRASGSGPKPKLPSEKVLSKQIRISLASHARLTSLAAERAKHITELVDEAVEKTFPQPSGRTGRPVTEVVGDDVDRMSVPPAGKPGSYPEGYEQ